MKNVLTKQRVSVKVNSAVGNVLAGVAQPVEQLICNQQVGGSNPSTSSKLNMEEFPSGQRGQTVNLLRFASVVRIHPPPPSKDTIEIRTLKFRLNGVFIIKSSIYAAFRGRIFFLSAGLKTEKLKFGNEKI